MSVLSVKNLSKSIKNNLIIDDISFDIAKGQIVGLLGPNGAGKNNHLLFNFRLNKSR